MSDPSRLRVNMNVRPPRLQDYGLSAGDAAVKAAASRPSNGLRASRTAKKERLVPFQLLGPNDGPSI